MLESFVWMRVWCSRNAKSQNPRWPGEPGREKWPFPHITQRLGNSSPYRLPVLVCSLYSYGRLLRAAVWRLRYSTTNEPCQRSRYQRSWSQCFISLCTFLCDWKRTNGYCFRFFKEETLNEDYKYSESGVYFAPAENLLTDYQDYVNNLPINDDPEVFGMHNNANLSFQVRTDQWSIR